MMGPETRMKQRAGSVLACFLILFASQILAQDAPVVRCRYVTDEGVSIDAVAKILVEAQDGGRLIERNDGRIVSVDPGQWEDSTDVLAADAWAIQPSEFTKQLQREFGSSFRVKSSPHYYIVTDSSPAYVTRVQTLFETLHKNFFTYWKNQGVSLDKPTTPLVAVVLKSRASYLAFAKPNIGESAQTMIGYYDPFSNWIVTYDVPDFERNVATIIHEATHQLAFNVGLQRRMADNPLWVSEGLATYFESPDRRDPRKWRAIGIFNQVNFDRLKRYWPSRGSDSLKTLIESNRRFESASTAGAAYGESWALTYFLIRTRKNEYIDYLARLRATPLLAELSPSERVAMFCEAFNADLNEIDKQFRRYMLRLRR
ncbi:MAG: DUF1570 domain-containing protein [Planctomycetota bacterium]